VVLVKAIEIEIAQIVVGDVLREHVADGDQDLVGNGNGSTLIAAACF
jgi:hypothetical protein